MSDIETLEDLATWALKEYADAIRGVLKENERLRADADRVAAACNVEMADLRTRWNAAEARIDAALALPIIAWATLCKTGDVHEFEEHCALYLADDQARDAAEILDDDPDDLALCGPHVVVELKALKGEKHDGRDE